MPSEVTLADNLAEVDVMLVAGSITSTDGADLGEEVKLNVAVQFLLPSIVTIPLLQSASPPHPAKVEPGLATC
ncbi:TPA: hypothetical protein DCX66_03960 [Candidatus Nomurabacteria bacterium]|nr:hypothetical protein [Candidatus Nomurabacteria bacterium]HAX65593.1 hypothetical protein [Candidatus Nomurabacteria bacterium]